MLLTQTGVPSQFRLNLIAFWNSAKELSAERPLRDNLSDAEIKLIADHHYWSMLHGDEEETREGTGRDELMRDIAKQFDEAGIEYETPIPPGKHAPPFGLSGGDVLRRINDLEFLMPAMKRALATGDVSKVDEFLDEELHLFGINLDKNSEAFRRLGMAVLRKQVAALDAIKQRIEGEPIETPQRPLVEHTQVAGETLRAAFEGWKRQNDPAPGTLVEYERAIRLFTELHGDLPVSQIRKSHVRQFREALQAVPRRRTGKLLNATLPELAEWGRAHASAEKTAAGTVNKLLGGVQAVAVWAEKNGMVPDDAMWSDPFTRMRLTEGEAVRGGAPFELEELQTIFSTPVFTEGERPEGGQGEAAFWLPLLALFTGGRLQELTALRASDVAHNVIIGAKVFAIVKDRKVGKRLKTERSERAIPLHPQLIEFGFLDYVAARSKGTWCKGLATSKSGTGDHRSRRILQVVW